MNKIAFVLLYIFSILLIPILLLNINTYKIDSPYYYIHNFKNNKAYFEKIVELEICMSDRNVESKEYKEYKSQLFKFCRVDSISLSLCDDNTINVEFYMSDSHYYPSTENKYRMIVFQPKDELPEHLKNDFNKKITSNWFFVTNDNQYYWNAIIIISIILFDLFIWIFCIIKYIKFKKHII